MSTRKAAWLTWCLCAMSWALIALSILFLALNWSAPLPESWGFRGFMGILAAMFTNMGTVISFRRPEHRIGWLFLSIGLVAALQFAASEYGIYAGLVRPGALPAATLMAWAASWVWVLMLGLFLLMCLLFPDGHLPSPRWRLVVGFGCTWVAAYALALMLAAGPLTGFGFINNPFGLQQTGLSLVQLRIWIYPSGLLVICLCVGSLFVRLRRATGEQRQQLKWFVYVVTLAGLALMFANTNLVLADSDVKPFQYLAILGIMAVPLTVGLSILRYHLFEIDRVINRTIVYGVLSVVLGAIYVGSVVLLRTLFRALTGEQPEFVTVLSTLVIAALFVPLRRRIQSAIDQQFNRKHYNAAKTLETFSIAIRDEVDMARLREDLLAVVSETMQPTQVSLWLKTSHARAPSREGTKDS